MARRVNWSVRWAGLLALAAVLSCAIRHMPRYEKNPTLPQVQGVLRVPGLHGEVKVYRDRWGVPHIFTEDAHDLFFADGYVQAQDRLWEMALFRAIGTGTLSEIFGNIGIPGQAVMGMKLTTLDMDKRMRIMGMRFLGEAGEALLAETNPDILAQMQAFCDGINAFIAQNQDRLPIEFQVLYYQPEPFRPADVIGLSRFFASNLTANMETELLRYALLRKYGEDMAWKLVPLHDSLVPTIVPKEMLKNRLSEPRPLPPGGRPDPSLSGLSGDAALRLAQVDRAIRAASLFPQSWASNNWVVGPKVTATGTAMLANDPHLVHVEPSLCYVMHLKGAGYDAYGVVFPGQPFVVMGHTRKLSWAATVTGADTQDLFLETVDPTNPPGQSRYQGEWREFMVHKEEIRVRPGHLQWDRDRRFHKKVIEVRHSIHGPIINDMVADLPKDTPPLALRWVGWDFSRDPRLFEQFITLSSIEEFVAKLRQMDPKKVQGINVAIMFSKLMKGRSIQDFIEAQGYNEILNMNWLAADADGHIAYLPGGLVPVRKKGLGVMPVPGEKGDYDWVGFIPLLEHPYAIDPERGWMATANNEVVDAEWYPYVFATNYGAGWRAWRIEELIQQLQPITVDKMRRIQNDVHVKQADVFVPLILRAVEAKGVTDKRILHAAKILREWDHEATIDSPAPAIFYDTMRHLPDRVLKDDFKKKDYNEWIKGNISQAVEMWVIKGESGFFDNKKTRKVEDRNDALVGALEDAVKWISSVLGDDMDHWQWGQLHTIKWYHPMGFGPLKDMSIGPFPHPGGENTVRNASSMGFGKRRYMGLGGPVMRHIMDMGDPDHALLVIDGSESGQWLSPHYRDMHTLWFNSDYMVAEMRPEQIAESAESLLTLTPEK